MTSKLLKNIFLNKLWYKGEFLNEFDKTTENIKVNKLN